ncbi:MAG: endonuclease III, partial [Myxococcota bacterium]|nr:endonuclease III [Myxococcota bacterium]
MPARRPRPPRDVEGLLARLRRAIPVPFCELRASSPWELLVATVLAARSTDRTANEVTARLLARWPTPAALAGADLRDVEDVVRSSGYYRQKARALRALAACLVERHGGEVPRAMDELVELPGVGRKTANVVLGTAFGVAEGIIVDTHSGRVARRLGLATATDPDGIERQLCAHVDRTQWIETGHRLTLHGRYVCLARKPRCADCPLQELCPSAAAPPAHRDWKRRADDEWRLILARAQNVPDAAL